jgi:hypothetical protein
MWTNPIETLLAFLGEPDPLLWLRRAEAVCAGTLQVARAKSVCDAGGVPERVMASLRGSALPAAAPGRIAVCSAADAVGSPLTVVLDQRADLAWSAFTLIDDRDETILADEETHRRRWAAWLYWGNLLQFLDAGAGDSGQFALTELDLFDPSQLAAAGGGGFLTALSLLPLDDDLTDATPFVRRPPADVTEPVRPTPGGDVPGEETAASQPWEPVLDLLDPDEPGLALLAQTLAERGVPVPMVGYELGEQAWLAELAWPAVRVAVVLAGDDEEARRRDAAYAEAGWDARPVPGWTPEELTERIGGAK